MQVQLDRFDIFILLAAIVGRINYSEKYKNYVYFDGSDYKLNIAALLDVTDEQLWNIYCNCK